MFRQASRILMFCTILVSATPDTSLRAAEWESVAPMNTGRFSHAAALGNDGCIYVSGGRDGSTTYATVERYDPNTDSWAFVDNLREYRNSHVMVNAGGCVYAIGGDSTVGGTFLDSMETYDEPNNLWTTSPYRLNVARAAFGATVGRDGKIYIMGGIGQGGLLTSAEVFDPYEPSLGWQMLGHDLNTARFMLQAGTDGLGRIYAICGILTDGTPIEFVERFDPTNPSAGWNPNVPTLNTPRGKAGYATAPWGSIYIVGGHGLEEVYNFLDGTWSEHSELLLESDCLPAVIDPDHRLYAIGGNQLPTMTEVQRIDVSMDGLRTYDDPNAFLAAAGPQIDFIDFETFGDGSPVAGEPNVTGDEWQNLGAVVSPENPANGLRLREDGADWEPNSPTHALATQVAADSSIIIEFPQTVESFGLTICDSEIGEPNERIVLYDADDKVVGTLDLPYYGSEIPGSESNYFCGFICGIPVAKVLIHEYNGDGILLDDLMYTRTYSLRLTIGHPEWGDVSVVPDLPVYEPNAEVTLTARAVEGRVWNGWGGDVDPNDRYTNPLTITIDRPRDVETAFKCGFGVGPMLPVMLGVLGLFVWIRRNR